MIIYWLTISCERYILRRFLKTLLPDTLDRSKYMSDRDLPPTQSLPELCPQADSNSPVPPHLSSAMFDYRPRFYSCHSFHSLIYASEVLLCTRANGNHWVWNSRTDDDMCEKLIPKFS